jgi:hypothetical protein
MEPDLEPDQRLAETRLRASRPEPDADFVRELEHRLMPPERALRRARLSLPHLSWRPVAAGAGLAGALAAGALAFGLGGSGPAAPSGSTPAQARENCRYVRVERRVRVPALRVDRDGNAGLTTSRKTVTQRVIRCR